MSGSGYGNIERGETDIPLSKLLEIAKIFGTDVAGLFGDDVSGKNIFNFNRHENHIDNRHNDCSLEQTKLQSELDKKQLIIEQQTKEIEFLRQQNADLREIIRLSKRE